VANKSQCPFAYQVCLDCSDMVLTQDNKRYRYLTEQCRQQQIKSIMLLKSGLFGKDFEETFQNAKIDKYNKHMYQYLQDQWNRVDWQYIFSENNGTGKSYTANAIANMFIDYGIQPLVEREIDMANALKNTFSDKTGESEYALMGKWKCIPVLIIQDLGKNANNSEWFPQQLYDIIDARLIKKYVTVFTSNIELNRETFNKKFGYEHGGAIFSRLNGQCEVWEMKGVDRRKINDR
jgi:DNA replication protein DnaC